MKTCITRNTIVVALAVFLSFLGSSSYAQENSSAFAIDTSAFSSISTSEISVFEQQARETENNNREIIVIRAPWENNYEVTPGTANIHVANFIAQCNEGVNVGAVYIQTDSPNAPQILNHVRILFDGAQFGEAATLTWSGGTYGAKFSGYFNCTDQPSHYLEISADIAANATGSIRMGIKRIRVQQGEVINVPIYGAVHSVHQLSAHPAGSNVVDANDDIWLITNVGTRRKYTSLEAYGSYAFNGLNQFVPANAGDLALPVGDPIVPQEGRLYRDHNVLYLISGNTKYPASDVVFSGLGFNLNPDYIGNADLSAAILGNAITSPTACHPAGTLINIDGLVLITTQNGRMGIPNLDVFNSWGFSFSRIVIATTCDRNLPTEPLTLQSRIPGQLRPLDPQ